MHEYTHTILQHFSFMFLQHSNLDDKQCCFPSEFDLLIHQVVFQALASNPHLPSDEIRTTKCIKGIYNE